MQCSPSVHYCKSRSAALWLSATILLIGTAYKNALGLRPYTTDDKLEALNVHNTFEDIQTPILLSQRERLVRTETGRDILTKVGYLADLQLIQSRVNLSPEHRVRVHVAPIPKNMPSTQGKAEEKPR